MIAAHQVANYKEGFKQLEGFNNIKLVTLTRESSILYSNIQSISWSMLISRLHDITPKDSSKIIEKFVNFIIIIKGSMKYYEEEILAIPAGNSIDAVLKTGIYECPSSYNTHRRSLFITFKGAQGGDMKVLYKLEDVYELDINDQSAINAISNTINDFGKRINDYKNEVNYDKSCHILKKVYVLDLSSKIELPITVCPLENNTGPAYYDLNDFLSKVNSDIEKVIVQKYLYVDSYDTLHVNTNGKKYFSLKFK